VRFKLRILLLLALLVGLAAGTAAQDQSATDRSALQVPDTCEGNSLRLDAVRNKSVEAGADKVTIAIARLGSGERSQELSRRRLYTVRAYLMAMGLPSQRLITAEGARAERGYGRIEIYVGGELVDVLAAERGKDLPVGICDDDVEDRKRYQRPRRRNTRQSQ
jgi:hypothetical protein